MQLGGLTRYLSEEKVLSGADEDEDEEGEEAESVGEVVVSVDVFETASRSASGEEA